jgi:hypothetical protein
MPYCWHMIFLYEEKSMIPSDNQQYQQPQKKNNSQEEKDQIVRQDEKQPETLKAEDLPESDNNSTGAIGSGQRQDSN